MSSSPPESPSMLYQTSSPSSSSPTTGHSLPRPHYLTPQIRLPSVATTQLLTSIGLVDFAKLPILCHGGELLNLFAQIVANNTRYAKGHEALDVAIRRFLGDVHPDDLVLYSTSLYETHGYKMPDFVNNEHYQGLRYKYLHLRWEPDSSRGAPNRPSDLGIVPCFHTDGSLIADNSLAFGTPMIGDGQHWTRAVLLQPTEPTGYWQHILAQTDRINRPVYFRVPVGKVVPYWPQMHDPHLLLLAEIAPYLTGLVNPGLANIKKAADECYRPPDSVKIASTVREISPRHDSETAGPVSPSWPGYPVLADQRQLGDWMWGHLAPVGLVLPPVVAPTIPVPDHWCEPTSEPPTDDFQFLTLDPEDSLRTRGRTLRRVDQSLPPRSSARSRNPPSPTIYDALPRLGTYLVTPPSSDASSSSEDSSPTSVFTSPSVETLTTLRSSRSLLSLRPLKERIRKFSTGRKKNTGESSRQQQGLPMAF
ncbi:hypothetical protein V5O48_015742 [Marasmius crinis-equi]|uniref:Uncharacterized protein n=1 Tax=Marasmius crinis-equi TaxID=585013 RepID=A0ABR3ETP6_9AGAR